MKSYFGLPFQSKASPSPGGNSSVRVRETWCTRLTGGMAIGSTILGLIAPALTGCATNDPWRHVPIAWDGARPSICDESYSETDYLIWREVRNPATSVKSREELNKRVDKIIEPQFADRRGPKSDCWSVSYENHQGLPVPKNEAGNEGLPAPGYDLFLAEFDDQGERVDFSRDHVQFEKSEVAFIESKLETILEREVERGGGINIVLFTHGWHGSASATDDYSIWFKAMLEQISYFEKNSRRSICYLGEVERGSERDKLPNRSEGDPCLSMDRSHSAQATDHRTVGIEIAWRGDSEDIPYLSWANFWDRKSAAQTVAKGGIHDLLARLHKFYLANSCHGREIRRSPNGPPCDTVHMLTIGHSFGALIDYHTLNDALSAGLLGDSHRRAYGFGDLTVFLNPAFEGERESTFVEAAIHRTPYPRDFPSPKESQNGTSLWPPGAQMPVVVTLQSRADWATHYAFPAARVFTGFFENTPGAHEYTRSRDAAGWIEYYQTHLLTLGPKYSKDNCDLRSEQPSWFCPFDLQREDPQPNSLNLSWIGPPERPDYFPLWTVAVDKEIMRNHDDISNPAIIRFVAQLFRAAYEQEELLHRPEPSSERP